MGRGDQGLKGRFVDPPIEAAGRRLKDVRKRVDPPIEAAGRRLKDVRKRVEKLAPARRRREERTKRAAIAAAALAAGATITYYLDPQLGRTRRARAKDRVAGAVRGATGRVGRLKRRVESDAGGLVQRMRHRGEEIPPNDATLAHKVESEILGGPDIPKGAVLVDAADGVVALRGEIGDPEIIRTLEKQARKIPGVRKVENYLHPPGTPAPNKEEARRADPR